MFESARVKLTLFYLAIILVISLCLTLGVRSLAQKAFDDADVHQRGGLQTIFRQQASLPFPSHPYNALQVQQENQVHHQLNIYVIELNLVALLVGGVASYWYAGRTLKPIQEAHLAQARFASDASHELRTPLTVMKTENEVFLRQKEITEDDSRKQIKSNLEEIQRLEQLAANLLSLANYEEGDRLDLKNIKSSVVSKIALEQVEKINPDSKSRIKVNVDNVKIFGNVESLAQILTIFMDNAIKYGPKDETVKLVGKKQDDVYLFSVEDKGPGIKREDMPLIFERLYRGNKNRNKTIPGRGLGLSLAREIAKANEAGLSVSNLDGGGAAFSLAVNLA